MNELFYMLGLIISFILVWTFLFLKVTYHYKLLKESSLNVFRLYLYIFNPFALGIPEFYQSNISISQINKGAKYILGWIISAILFYVFLYLLT